MPDAPSAAPGSRATLQTRILDIPKSGRRGKFVYYMRGRRLCRRLYVVPRNVRTPARRRARGAFGTISKAWGEVLTEPQRRAWLIAAAEVESHPRLWQSGPLTGEMYFQGLNSARARIGRKLLLWPPQRVVFGPNPVEELIRRSPGRAGIATPPPAQTPPQSSLPRAMARQLAAHLLY